MKRPIPTWAVLKGTYALIGVVLAGLGVFGVLSETEVNSLSGQLGDVVMIIGGLISGVASGRTGPDSGNDRPLIVIDPDTIAETIDRAKPVVTAPIDRAREHIDTAVTGTPIDDLRRRIHEGN
ncbi:hypothetical protein ACFORJ_01795 [Corynebacterium hansenii]|uniref:Holin n=1 Tax=Corynebacterium hansenii TaxID=394964 RepID=A0ABV7ZNS8_9CORY|nr:hypothetical protein [Corynebacterium hansenii]WJY99268.1 hypothetical protein CHAN_03200 [Corynebacterium hansenii]